MVKYPDDIPGPGASRVELDAGKSFIRTSFPQAMEFQLPEDTYAGVVTGAEEYPQRSYDSREIKLNPDGTPLLGLAIFVEAEDGSKWTYYVSSFVQKKNLREAYQQADVKGIAAGDRISITYIGDITTKRGNNAKNYKIVIEPKLPFYG